MEKDREHNKVLGSRVRDIRKAEGLTQKQLADLLFYTNDKTIAAIENGRRNITRQTADKMASLFNIDVNYLLDENVKYKSNIDQINDVLNKSAYENDLIIQTIVCLASLQGFEVEINNIGGEGKISAFDYFQKMHEFMVFSINGVKQFSLSLETVNALGNSINDCFSAILNLVVYKGQFNTLRISHNDTKKN